MGTSRKNIIRLLGSAAVLILFFCACTAPQKSRNHQQGSNDLRPRFSQQAVYRHKNLGNTYYRNGSYKMAEKEFKAVLKYDPTDYYAHYKLGVIYARQGLTKKGLFKFMETICFNQNFSKAYYNLGTIYSSEGPHLNIDKAIFFFEKYLGLEPTSRQKDKIEVWLSKHKMR